MWHMRDTIQPCNRFEASIMDEKLKSQAPPKRGVALLWIFFLVSLGSFFVFRSIAPTQAYDHEFMRLYDAALARQRAQQQQRTWWQKANDWGRRTCPFPECHRWKSKEIGTTRALLWSEREYRPCCLIQKRKSGLTRERQSQQEIQEKPTDCVAKK